MALFKRKYICNNLKTLFIFNFLSMFVGLTKSLYGLKQAPRAWFECFTTQLLSLGFVASLSDPSLFVRNVGGSLTYLLLYVDDVMLTGNDLSYIDLLVVQLKQSFDMTDLGSLTYFLGLEVQRKASGIFVTQTKYTRDLLSKFGMAEFKPCSTPCSAARYMLILLCVVQKMPLPIVVWLVLYILDFYSS